MRRVDPAIEVANPRFIAAIYFGLLSVIGTILTTAFLASIGFEEVVPVFRSVILGMVVASGMGALFGERIIHCKKPYKATTFWLGFVMVVASLPLFDLGLLFFMTEQYAKLFVTAKFHSLVFTYLIMLVYSYVLFGFLLAIASGLAAMYLRSRLIYDIIQTYHSPNRRVHHPTSHCEK